MGGGVDEEGSIMKIGLIVQRYEDQAAGKNGRNAASERLSGSVPQPLGYGCGTLQAYFRVRRSRPYFFKKSESRSAICTLLRSENAKWVLP